MVGPAREGDVNVTVSVFDILAALKTSVDAGFAQVAEALRTKADKSDVESLRGELRSHDTRLGVLEAAKAVTDNAVAVHHQRDVDDLSRRERRWKVIAGVWAAVMSFGLVLVSAFALVH